MKHEVRFQTPRQAMNYACGYNRRGVHIVLKAARKCIREGEPMTLATLQMLFAFAGIQGYPVACFHKRLQSAPNIR